MTTSPRPPSSGTWTQLRRLNLVLQLPQGVLRPPATGTSLGAGLVSLEKLDMHGIFFRSSPTPRPAADPAAQAPESESAAELHQPGRAQHLGAFRACSSWTCRTTASAELRGQAALGEVDSGVEVWRPRASPSSRPAGPPLQAQRTSCQAAPSISPWTCHGTTWVTIQQEMFTRLPASSACLSHNSISQAVSKWPRSSCLLTRSK